tara:strand:+ start:240 stop:971 length:732 start_codon:yes stop_codon:yes gene_type:complete
MGGKTSTSSGSYGGDDRGRDRNDRSIEAEITGGTKKVKEEIKKSGTDMYGGVASKATNEYLESIGEATKGSQNPDGSYNYRLTGRGHQLKYGSYNVGGTQNPTGMGTVGAGGIMNQIPISEKMFESQKRLQMIATGAMSALGVPLMGAAFMDYNRKKYSDYVTSFNNTLESSTSYVTKRNESKSDNKEINTSSNVTVNDSGVDGGPSEAARLKKLALTKQTAAINAERKLFNTTKQTITGAMV